MEGLLSTGPTLYSLKTVAQVKCGKTVVYNLFLFIFTYFKGLKELTISPIVQCGGVAECGGEGECLQLQESWEVAEQWQEEDGQAGHWGQPAGLGPGGAGAGREEEGDCRNPTQTMFACPFNSL